MGNKLKLFVWEGVLTDFSDGIMFALAENVEQAREKISKSADYCIPESDLSQEPKVYETPVGFAVWGGG